MWTNTGSLDTEKNGYLRGHMRRILRITLGIILIILGVVAALTPFSPGSWLALIGLEILGLRLLFQRKLLSWTPRKYRGRLKNLLNKRKKKA
ncbi:MAG: hypothetical protein RQ760_09750 [Sedimentisphaerales bacterium]|nr:hypothetical protein [Sedimentisphaerales bacterium]